MSFVIVQQFVFIFGYITELHVTNDFRNMLVFVNWGAEMMASRLNASSNRHYISILYLWESELASNTEIMPESKFDINIVDINVLYTPTSDLIYIILLHTRPYTIAFGPYVLKNKARQRDSMASNNAHALVFSKFFAGGVSVSCRLFFLVISVHVLLQPYCDDMNFCIYTKQINHI